MYRHLDNQSRYNALGDEKERFFFYLITTFVVRV